MLVLKENEICPHASRCPYSSNCWGARADRGTKFTCEVIQEDGSFSDLFPLGKTGKMKILLEEKQCALAHESTT